MPGSFSSAFPSWLVQPRVLKNVFSNQFSSLQNVSSAVTVPDFALFHSGLKQALYWRRRLSSTASVNTVIFSFLGVGGLILPNVLEVCQALKDICDMSKLVEVYRAPNSPFIGISFCDSSQSSIFQSLCASFNQFVVIHVSPCSPLTHQFKLLWLPPMFSDNRIHHFLAKHSTHHHFTRELIETDTNSFTPTNSVSGIIQLSPHQDVNSIPHLIPLPAPHSGSALFIISGRSSLCLKCGSIGHIRRHCSAPKCTSCHQFHLATALCSSSEVSSVRSVANPWELEDLSSPSQPLSSSIISDSPHKCDRTHVISPPIHSSSPVLATSDKQSYAEIVSSVTPSVYTYSAAGTAASYSSIDLTAAKLDISSNIAASVSSIQLENASFISASGIKAVVSSKRAHTLSSSSSSSSQHLDKSSSNIFTLLVDEVVPVASVSSDGLPFTPVDSAVISSDLSNTLSSAATTASTSVVAPSSLYATSTSSSHKRAKRNSSISSTSTTTSSATFPQPASAANVVRASSWGELMEEEGDVTFSTSPLHSSASLAPSLQPSSPSHSVSSIVPIDDTHKLSSFHNGSQATDSTHGVSHVLSSSSLIMSTSGFHLDLPVPRTTESSDADSINSEHHTIDSHGIEVQLVGFPAHTPTEIIADFLGSPQPKGIYLDYTLDDIFTGIYIAVYDTDDDAMSALERDGHWFESNIISVSLVEPPIVSSSP